MLKRIFCYDQNFEHRIIRVEIAKNNIINIRELSKPMDTSKKCNTQAIHKQVQVTIYKKYTRHGSIGPIRYDNQMVQGPIDAIQEENV